jgi:hypothetical protein
VFADTSRNARRWTALAQRQCERDLMSVAEVAQILNVSRVYVVRRLLRKHALRPVGDTCCEQKPKRIAANEGELRAERCGNSRAYRRKPDCTLMQISKCRRRL